MEQVKRYAFEGEVIEVPLRWDEGAPNVCGRLQKRD